METEVTQINLYKDGDAWCALIGDDIQSGTCGFGQTKSDALRALAISLNLNSTPAIIEPNTFRKD
ncbi:hypothetical protein [Chroococcidiopsis sp.]|uniref:hypothetical protein n=1 Tax=Chroococcidiopsis sp. TaxID=3088168 RepID=UPI003F3E6B66